MNATHDKKQKDKARKRGASLRRKVVELGKHCDILSAVIYWNPTRKALEAVMYLPDGQVVPDLNQLFRDLEDTTTHAPSARTLSTRITKSRRRPRDGDLPARYQMRSSSAQLCDQESNIGQASLDNHIEIAESITNSEIEATAAALLGGSEQHHSSESADTAVPTCSTDVTESHNPFATEFLCGDYTTVSGDAFWDDAEQYICPAASVTKRPKQFKEERSSLASKVLRMLQELTEQQV